jgi:hypothetical protein
VNGWFERPFWRKDCNQNSYGRLPAFLGGQTFSRLKCRPANCFVICVRLHRVRYQLRFVLCGL